LKNLSELLLKSANAFGGTFAFFPTAQSQAKKCKRATKPTHQDRHKMTTNNHDRKKGRSANSGFAKKRVQSLIEHSTSHQILWYVDSLVLRNPLLRKAAFQDQKQVFS
jgi:hypothetical protein